MSKRCGTLGLYYRNFVASQSGVRTPFQLRSYGVESSVHPSKWVKTVELSFTLLTTQFATNIQNSISTRQPMKNNGIFKIWQRKRNWSFIMHWWRGWINGNTGQLGAHTFKGVSKGLRIPSRKNFTPPLPIVGFVGVKFFQGRGYEAPWRTP